MVFMSLTLNTFHFEISPLNDPAPMKMELMSMILDTSHSPIAPCGPAEQSPFGDNFRHAVTLFLSASLVCGENTDSPTQEFSEIKMTRVKMMTWYTDCEPNCTSWWSASVFCVSGGLSPTVRVGIAYTIVHDSPVCKASASKSCQVIVLTPGMRATHCNEYDVTADAANRNEQDWMTGSYL